MLLIQEVKIRRATCSFKKKKELLVTKVNKKGILSYLLGRDTVHRVQQKLQRLSQDYGGH